MDKIIKILVLLLLFISPLFSNLEFTPGECEKSYSGKIGKYLFFLSMRAGKYKIYWMDAKIIDEFKPEELK